MQPPPPGPYLPPQQTILVQGPPTSGSGTASLVLGILGALGGWCLLGIPCVLAVIFGHAALPDIRRGARSGRGLAVAGLVLGYVFAVPWIILGVMFLAGGLASVVPADLSTTPAP